MRTLLVANRGEIACRVIRTARRLGLRTVAVYSDADAAALHVRMAEAALRIGPAPAPQSYLSIEAILQAAKAAGADAIHPGYGFLSENARFAAACRAAGLAFVGPPAEAIAAMGDKAAAKARMAAAGVPVVPGYHGEDQSDERLLREARALGWPVLLKPAAGGGGKGMRVVREAAQFPSALEAARREAQAAFGDARLLLERYVERPRHVEVQVFGDRFGGVVHLYERDCSVQRRHQKIVEETPAPGLEAGLRERILAAGVAAARAIGYVGAGTVEFLVSPEGEFWFMEMNTRLQVEHPVTEAVTGVDLVEWQLRIAAGEALPREQAQIRSEGHAIEARLYAEVPERGFLPSTGRLSHLEFPPAEPGLRVDRGVEAGSEITPWYDPMIAKLVAHGGTREEARRRLAAALARTEIVGVETNRRFLVRLLESDDFASGHIDTGLVERNGEILLAPPTPPPVQVLAAAAYAQLAREACAARKAAGARGDPHSPWTATDGWRLDGRAHQHLAFDCAGHRHEIELRFDGGALTLVHEGVEVVFSGEEHDGRLYLRLGERSDHARAVLEAGAWHVFYDGEHWRLVPAELVEDVQEESAPTLAAPMPSRVVKLLVAEGARVEKGAPLVVLEAMKMEHTVTAPHAGRVRQLRYREGDQVPEGAEILVLEAL